MHSRICDCRQTTRRTAALTQKASAWCGPAVIVVCIVGLAVCARFVAPPTPLTSPAGIAAIFQQRTLGIRTGMMVMVLGAALLGPFFAVISVQMRRIEGPRPTLAYAQLMLGACFILEIIFPMMAIQTAVFRPERDSAIQQTFNDMGWLTFFGVRWPRISTSSFTLRTIPRAGVILLMGLLVSAALITANIFALVQSANNDESVFASP